MVKKFNSARILKVCSNKYRMVQFLIQQNLITNYADKCFYCKAANMSLQKDAQYKNDKLIWRCKNGYCRKTVTIRKNSLFSFSNLKIKVIYSLLV